MTEASKPRTILLAGGGTGGHIYPNVAIAERLAEHLPQTRVLFLVSNRPGDATIMNKMSYAWTTTCVQPLFSPRRPWRAFSFLLKWWQANREVQELLQRENVRVVITSGGFVSGPALMAAEKLGIGRAMVNLDAVPGKANRRLARCAQEIFTVHESPLLPKAKLIGLPLRKSSLGHDHSQHEARTALGLAPELPTLFITGATHGANSIIETMRALLEDPQSVARLRGWQVFHQCGKYPVEELQAAYDAAGVAAKVTAYCDQMGMAWRAADVAISRAGAGSVAEVWANAVPAIFMPNPFHDDGHQRRNVAPLLACGGSLVVNDENDAQANRHALAPVLNELLADAARREKMRTAMQNHRPADGALQVARWCESFVI
jgi:UDP-N-acetylglucosamine--N-acetylmuramyl-(pentapeptide) pyrophosphoryl-undecaprenol N-acetylglucosamine transferase